MLFADNKYLLLKRITVLLDHLLTYYNIIRIICQEHYVTQSQKCPKMTLAKFVQGKYPAIYR
jgi:hypothetical protein